MASSIATRLSLSADDSVATALRQIKDSIQETVKAGQDTFGQLAASLKDIGTELGKLPVEKAKTDLAGVGEAGKQALKQVGAAASATKLDLPVAAPKQQLSDLSSFARGVFDDIKGGVAGVKTEIENTLKSVAGFKTALFGLATAGVIGAGYKFVKDGIADFNELKKKADEAKLSLEEFQKLRFLYQEFGLSAKDADKAIAGNVGTEGTTTTSTRTGPNDTGGKIIAVTANEPVNADSLRRLSQSVALIDDYGKKVERAQVLLKSKDLATSFVDAQEGFFKRVKDAGALVEQTEKALNNASSGGVLLAQEAAAAARNAFEAIKGESGIDDHIKRYEALREVLKTGEQSAKEFTAAQKNLNQALLETGFASQQGRTSMALMLAPALTPIINAIAQSISSLNLKLAELSRDAGNAIKPAIEDIFKLFSALRGGNQIESSQLGSSFGKVLNELVIPALRQLKDLVGEAARSLSELFGGDVTPAMVAFGAIIVALLGPFNALALAVLAVFGSSSPAIKKFKEELKSVGVDVDAIKQKVVQTWNEIKAAMSGDESAKGTRGAGIAEQIKTIAQYAPEILGLALAFKVLGGSFGGLSNIVESISYALFGLLYGLRVVAFFIGSFATSAIGLALVATNLDKIRDALATIGVRSDILDFFADLMKYAREATGPVQLLFDVIKGFVVYLVALSNPFAAVIVGIVLFKDELKAAWDVLKGFWADLKEFLSLQGKAGPEEHKKLDEAPSAQKDFKLRPGRYVRPVPEGEGGADAGAEGGEGAGGDEIPANARLRAGGDLGYGGGAAPGYSSASRLIGPGTPGYFPNGTTNETRLYPGQGIRSNAKDEAIYRAPAAPGTAPADFIGPRQPTAADFIGPLYNPQNAPVYTGPLDASGFPPAAYPGQMAQRGDQYFRVGEDGKWSTYGPPGLSSRTVDPSKFPNGFGAIDPEEYAHKTVRERLGGKASGFFGPVDPDEYAADPGGSRAFQREQGAERRRVLRETRGGGGEIGAGGAAPWSGGKGLGSGGPAPWTGGGLDSGGRPPWTGGGLGRGGRNPWRAGSEGGGDVADNGGGGGPGLSEGIGEMLRSLKDGLSTVFDGLGEKIRASLTESLRPEALPGLGGGLQKASEDQSSMTPVYLQIPGGGTHGPFLAHDEVVQAVREALDEISRDDQMSSTGSKGDNYG